MPMVIPINEYCFGKRPADWASNTVFTDFIFLRQVCSLVQGFSSARGRPIWGVDTFQQKFGGEKHPKKLF